MATQSPQRPLKVFRAGAISAAIWRNEQQAKGETQVSYSIRPRKRYLVQETQTYQDSEYYFPSDLPKLQLVLAEAYRYVSLHGADDATEPRPSEESA